MSVKDQDFIMQFVQAYNNFNSVHTINTALKDLNMNPRFEDRDTVEKMVSNPKNYEKELRELSQYLMNTIMPLKRLRSYYANILEFDYTIIPIVEEKVMKSTAFKKAEKRVYDWLDALNPKKAYKKLINGAITEDAKYYYKRESQNGIALQEMPSDYCKIVYEDELSYRYAFNMNYFLKSGVSLDGFAPEFIQYYQRIFIENSKVDKYNPNWIELDPDKAFILKFDMFQAGITPPMIGLFVDSVEIDTYRNLKATKTALDAYKLLVGSIPRHKESKTGNKKNDFALTSKMAAEFSGLIKNSMPDGMDFKATPFEDVKLFEFGQSQNQSDISDVALKNLINNSGSSQIMSINKPVQSTVKSSQKVDESFVKHLYLQAEDFINHQLLKISPKYIFKIKFEGTIFDREEREKSAKEWATYGIITDKIGASMGYTPREFDKAIAYMKARGYPDKLIPLKSSHQINGDVGRPEASDNEISDNGAIAKEGE